MKKSFKIESSQRDVWWVVDRMKMVVDDVPLGTVGAG